MVNSWESYRGMFTRFVYLIWQIARELFTLASKRIHNLIINLTVRLIKRDPFLTKILLFLRNRSLAYYKKYPSLRTGVSPNEKPRSATASKDAFEINIKIGSKFSQLTLCVIFQSTHGEEFDHIWFIKITDRTHRQWNILKFSQQITFLFIINDKWVV